MEKINMIISETKGRVKYAIESSNPESSKTPVEFFANEMTISKRSLTRALGYYLLIDELSLQEQFALIKARCEVDITSKSSVMKQQAEEILKGECYADIEE